MVLQFCFIVYCLMLKNLFVCAHGWFSTHVLPIPGCFHGCLSDTSKSVLGKRCSNAAPLKPDMPHTHKYNCWACAGENTYRELAPVSVHWLGWKRVGPELQGCRRWFGREGVSVLRGDITGAWGCRSSALWHPDHALAFEVVWQLLGSAQG